MILEKYTTLRAFVVLHQVNISLSVESLFFVKKRQGLSPLPFSCHVAQGCSCVIAEQIDDVGLSPTSTPEKSTSIPYTHPRMAATMESMAEITIEINFFLLIVCLLYVYLPRTRQHPCGQRNSII